MTQTLKPELITSAGHIVWIEDGDVLVHKFFGKLDANNVDEILSFTSKHINFERRYFSIADFSKAPFSVDPEVRTLHAKWAKTHSQPECQILIGAGNAMRILVGLMFRAYAIIHNRPVPGAFVNTEEEARRMIQELKKKPQRA